MALKLTTKTTSGIGTGCLSHTQKHIWRLPEWMDNLSLVHNGAVYGIDIPPDSNFSMELLARNGITVGYSEYSLDQIQGRNQASCNGDAYHLTYLAGKRQNGIMLWTVIGSCEVWAVLYTTLHMIRAEQVNDFACIEMHGKSIQG